MNSIAIIEPIQTAKILHVLTPANQQSTDDLLAAEARRRLQLSPYFSLRFIMPESHEGVLVLRGQVSSFYHKQLAQETVRGLKGVGLVINAVEVIY